MLRQRQKLFMLRFVTVPRVRAVRPALQGVSMYSRHFFSCEAPHASQHVHEAIDASLASFETCLAISYIGGTDLLRFLPSDSSLLWARFLFLCVFSISHRPIVSWGMYIVKDLKERSLQKLARPLTLTPYIVFFFIFLF